MSGKRKLAAAAAAFLMVAVFASSTVLAAGGGGGWTTFGYDLSNSRYQRTETTISPANAGSLIPKWQFTAGGDVSATPAIDNASATAYFPDWAGNLFAVDLATGQKKWSTKISDYTGVTQDLARSTPAISGNLLILGDQGWKGGGGGRLLAINKNTGALVWQTVLETHPAAIVTGSAQVSGNTAYVGVSSLEEALAAFIPDYPCCSFRGSVVAVNTTTGAILWKSYMAPQGYSGASVWGSTPALDPARKTLYVTTGNNYSMPPDVVQCAVAAGDNSDALRACIDPADHFDSILALDANTGAIKWATNTLPADNWNVDCIPGFGSGANCPSAAGPDFDFGQGPMLFSTKATGDLVGAGQKSGYFWALRRDTGQVSWKTEVGPGGITGGLQWGSATDGKRIYVAEANSGKKPWDSAGGTTGGGWAALDAATGQVLWRTLDPAPVSDTPGPMDESPVSVANGVVYACSLDNQGHMYAMDAATGGFLWSYASGGSCLGGAAISNGRVYWGSGYASSGTIFGATPNNKFFAFGLP